MSDKRTNDDTIAAPAPDGDRDRLSRWVLDPIERIGNRLPHPVLLFVILAVLTIIGSAVLAGTGLSVEDPEEAGEVVEVTNLLSGDGVSYLFESMVENFVNFPPLGVVLATMIGIGLAERSGLITALLRGFVTSVPKGLITAGLVFAGIMSSVASDAGYVVLPPLGAMLFAALGRHPIAGLAAAFAGVSAGFSANLLLSATDPLLGSLTVEAAATIDPAYAETINFAMNYYFIIASSFVLTLTGWFVSAKIVEPRLGAYTGLGAPDDDEKFGKLDATERKGILWAGISVVITAALMSLLVLPEWAPMRGEGENPIVDSPFMQALVPLIMVLFLVPGLVYGLVVKSITSDQDVADQLSDTMSTMGMFIVLAFTAGQFVAYFNETNLGLILGVTGADFLERINLTGIPLVLAFILVVGIINLFVGSASAKWAILAPVFVPLMMQLGYSPELTTMAYRISDSTTNVITPLMPYFAILIAFARRYDKKAGIGSLVAAMLPYTVVFSIVWTIMLVIWMLAGWDLGPASPLLYEG